MRTGGGCVRLSFAHMLVSIYIGESRTEAAGVFPCDIGIDARYVDTAYVVVELTSEGLVPGCCDTVVHKVAERADVEVEQPVGVFGRQLEVVA